MTRIRLERGQAAIFGYGSLLSRASMETSLGRPYSGPFVAADVRGWTRDWSVAMPNRRGLFAVHDGVRMQPAEIIYLNVRPAPGAVVNGVLFVVDDRELAAFDRREWVYARERVNDALGGVVVEGGDAWLYTGLPEHVCDLSAPADQRAVRRSYVSIVTGALDEWGPAFRSRFMELSQPVPEHLVFDDQAPP